MLKFILLDMDTKIDRAKDALHHLYSKPYFPFLAAFLISGIVCIGALRHNNTTMISLREKVYAADQANGDVNTALNSLREYVYGHMNTNLSSSNGVKPPIQLKYTYERLEADAQQDSGNSNLYIEAKNYCEQKIPASVSFYGTGRISCVQDYILSHGGKATPTIPAGLYQFDFVSPSWSPDLAGWSLLATIVFLIAFILRLAFYEIKK